MKKLKRLMMAAIFGLAVTLGLVFFMMALIDNEHNEPLSNQLLTTQIKVSSPPGLKPATEINANSKKPNHQLPSKRKINLPIDFKSMVTDLMAQEADGDQTDPLAAPSRQQILLQMGSQSQAVVKLAGIFNVIGNDPEYPIDALLAGQEGWVDTLIHLKRDGSVKKVDILDAGPSGVFEKSVVVAVSEWKIQLDQFSKQELNDEYFHRFEFKISQ